MLIQKQITLLPKRRGFHLITQELLQQLGPLPDTGLLHLFILHTSAGIAINENADPSVLADFESSYNRIVPEGNHLYTHTAEGLDDMPAHIKASMVGCNTTIPITGGRLALGTWQGIYLCEFRNRASARKLIASIYQ